MVLSDSLTLSFSGGFESQPPIFDQSIDGDKIEKNLKKYLFPMIDKGIDHLVLGCTHYPLLIKTIRSLIPKNIKIIDSGKAVAKQTKKLIEKNNIELINKIKNEVNNAMFPELETTLNGPPLVSALSTRLQKVVSIDNGIMHMVGLANIPMIVLFGPTNPSKFAPKINNIDILDSKLIYN